MKFGWKLSLLTVMAMSALLLLAAGPAAAVEGGLGIKKIHFNRASAVNLAKAPGITDEIAEAIVEYRETRGFFKKPKDLLKVPGITKEVYDRINPQVGPEGDMFTVPRKGEVLEEEEDEPALSPSKC